MSEAAIGISARFIDVCARDLNTGRRPHRAEPGGKFKESETLGASS